VCSFELAIQVVAEPHFNDGAILASAPRKTCYMDMIGALLCMRLDEELGEASGGSLFPKGPTGRTHHRNAQTSRGTLPKAGGMATEHDMRSYKQDLFIMDDDYYQ
jgi:hypothetical protein